MSGGHKQKNRVGQDVKFFSGVYFASFVIVFSLLCFFGLTAHQANAQVVPVLDSLVASNTGTLAEKETVLDGIVTSAMQVVISNMTESIVRWINRGFEGGPAFVTDPANFFTDVGDQIAGNFIAGTELGFICEPFALDIRLALNLNYNSTFTEKNYCRLSDVISNTENFAKFTNGNFGRDGWDSWFEISQNPSNNPLGAYAAAQGELAIRTASGRDIELAKLNWGQGFLSSRECTVRDPDGNCVEYKINTPGSVINDQLGNALGTGYRKLELADEINEIVGALIGQISQTVLSEGLSSFGSGGDNNDYFDRPETDTTSPLNVICEPDITDALVGEEVTWTARAYGGTAGRTSYLWGGTGQLAGATTQSVTVTYANPGIKTGSVRISRTSGGGQVVTRGCDADVLVQ